MESFVRIRRNDTVSLVELVGFSISNFYLHYQETLLGVLIDQIRNNYE
jgi:hypothetical protein